MEAQLKAVVEYIIASRRALGANSSGAEGVVTTQFSHLKQLFQKGAESVSEASAVLHALSTPSVVDAFSAEQRKDLATALTGAGIVASPEKAGRTTKASLQTHNFLHNYLTNDDWNALVGDAVLTDKLAVIVNRSLKLGLTNPSEMTIVANIALLFVASRLSPTAEQGYALVLEYKKLNKVRRVGVTQTLASFPCDVQEFCARHGDAFDASDQPIASRVGADVLASMRQRIAARRSHKSLASGVETAASSSSAGATAQAMLAAMASMMCGHQNRQIPIQMCGPPHRQFQIQMGGPLTDVGGSSSFQEQAQVPAPKAIGVPPPRLAIKDAPETDESGSPPGMKDGTQQPQTLAEMEREMQEALANKAADARQKKIAEQAGIDANSGASAKGDKSSPKSAAKALKGSPKPKLAHGSPSAKACSPKSTLAKRPSITIERSRSQVLARTGSPGKGQSKAFAFQGSDTKPALKRARKWLEDEHNIVLNS